MLFLSQIAKVIKALDDSRSKRMNYLNRFWLRQNGRRCCLNIHISKEVLFVDFWEVSTAWKEKKSIIVQDGKELESLSEFRSNKEALLVVKRNAKHDSVVYLFVPDN